MERRETLSFFFFYHVWAAKITVAEVEEMVPAGQLDPNQFRRSRNFYTTIFKRKDLREKNEQVNRTVKLINLKFANMRSDKEKYNRKKTFDFFLGN